MAFGVNVHTAIAITSFAHAEQYFNRTPQQRGKNWQEPEFRPLGNNRQPHFALERINADTYGVNLYEKRVIIYHRPKDDGVRVSEFFATYHAATWAWLWRHANKGERNKMVDTSNRTVLVPIGTCSNTIIAVDESGQVIPELTQHPRIYTRVSNDEDKAKRKRFKEKLEVVVDIAMMQLQWTGARKNFYECKGAFDRMIPNSAQHLYAFDLQAQLKYLAANTEADFDPNLIDVVLAVANPAYNYYEEKPDTHAFKKNFTQYLIRQAQLDTQSGKKFYGHLPDYDKVPKAFHLTDKQD